MNLISRINVFKRLYHPMSKKQIIKPPVKEFDLSIILSFTCGYLVTEGETIIEKIANQMELVYFLDDYMQFDSYIPPENANEKIADHLLKLYPFLINVKYNPNLGININDWVNEQKAIYGEKLAICSFNHTLEEYNVSQSRVNK